MKTLLLKLMNFVVKAPQGGNIKAGKQTNSVFKMMNFV